MNNFISIDKNGNIMPIQRWIIETFYNFSKMNNVSGPTSTKPKFTKYNNANGDYKNIKCKSDISGNMHSDISGNMHSDISGNIHSDISGNMHSNISKTIKIKKSDISGNFKI